MYVSLCNCKKKSTEWFLKNRPWTLHRWLICHFIFSNTMTYWHLAYCLLSEGTEDRCIYSYICYVTYYLWSSDQIFFLPNHRFSFILCLKISRTYFKLPTAFCNRIYIEYIYIYLYRTYIEGTPYPHRPKDR